jgi:hypothetical protein
VEVGLRKIEGNGVELEGKFKVQWRLSGVDVKTNGGGVEVELEV